MLKTLNNWNFIPWISKINIGQYLFFNVTNETTTKKMFKDLGFQYYILTNAAQTKQLFFENHNFYEYNYNYIILNIIENYSNSFVIPAKQNITYNGYAESGSSVNKTMLSILNSGLILKYN